MKTKRLLKEILLLVVLILMIVGVYHYSSEIAPDSYKITNKTISSQDIPYEFTGFKIGFISDIYLKDESDIKRFEEIVQSLNEQECDLVLFGGDLYLSNPFEQEHVVSIFQSITAKYGRFAVLGEKDFVDMQESIRILEQGGFEILRNQLRNIYYQDDFIYLLGLESSSDLTHLQTSGYTIALIHEPDYFTSLKEQNIHLQLSGHSNGGYVYIPFFGALHEPSNAKTYNHGVYQENGKTLIVSNGLGMDDGQKFRLFSPPQVLIVTLKSKQNEPFTDEVSPPNENEPIHTEDTNDTPIESNDQNDTSNDMQPEENQD